MPIIDMPEEEYYSDSTLLTNSALKVFRKSPIEYRRRFIDGHRKTSDKSPALVFGSAVHALVEGNRDAVAVLPEVDRRTKAGKQEELDFQEQNSGKLLLTKSDFYLAKDLAEMSRYYLQQCGIQPTHYEGTVTFSWDGVECKSRLDIIEIRDGSCMIADVKTCDNLHDFERRFFEFGYARQAAYYLEAVSHLCDFSEFRFVVVSKKERMVCGYTVDPKDISHARREIEGDLERFRFCRDSNLWGEPKVLASRRYR